MQTLDRTLTQIGYDARYDTNWNQISKATEESTGGYCSYPGCWQRGCEAHHVAYRDEDGAIAGREKPGVHVFWLCNKHHSVKDRNGAHHPSNWNSGILPPPTLDAQNTAEYYLKLRKGFKEKQQWVQRMKKEDPYYKFITRKNGFRRTQKTSRRKR